MSIWVILILVVVILVLVTSLVLYFIQSRILFQPEKISKNYQFNFSKIFEEIFLKAPDGMFLNGVLFQLEKPVGVVIYYHNHSGNLTHCSNAVYTFNRLHFDVLVMDYRGFGKSEGDYDEAKMYEDANLWYDHAKKHYEEGNIILYGRGLGACFAASVASKNNPKLLCIESAMYSLLYATRFHYRYLPIRWILRYSLNTASSLKNVTCKTSIFHGVKDDVIHYSNSEKLHSISKDTSELILIPNGTHHNLGSNPMYLQKIEEILTEL